MYFLRVICTLCLLFPVVVSATGLSNEPITPLSLESSPLGKKAILGRTLFHDPQLSSEKTISCASCHLISEGGDDGMSVSVGVFGRLGAFNSPTVLNSSLNHRFFWDGRAITLEEQIDGPIRNPNEMNNNWTTVIQTLSEVPEYNRDFDELYGEISVFSIKNALIEYMKALITPSPFDRYLLGDKEAISQDAKDGYILFKQIGCVSCHQGRAIGGNMFEKLGVFKPYFVNIASDSDLGRYRQTRHEENLYEFKVPSLRNVAKTAPYLHNGSVNTLEEMIKIMGEYQLGVNLTQQQISILKAFLESLNGELRQGVLP